MILIYLPFLNIVLLLDSSGADKGIEAARDCALFLQVVSMNKDGDLDCFSTEFKIPLWIKVLGLDFVHCAFFLYF